MYPRILFMILTLAVFSIAQERNFRVIVEDPNGGRVIGAEVTISPVSGQARLHQGTTNNDGIAQFRGVAFGRCKLEIRAPGFEELISEIECSESNTKATARLKIKSLDESVEVITDPRIKALESPIGNFLTREQIDALPDSPEEMEEKLKEMAGGGDVVIRVDGFSTSSLPPKSQIASIRIVRSSVDAENHELGSVYVEVTSKPGDMKLGGSISYDFQNSTLNARNPFSSVKPTSSNGNLFFALAGPIKKNKASFYLTLLNIRRANNNVINAITDDGAFSANFPTEARITTFNGSIFHGLSAYHNARYSYQYRNNLSLGNGVGGFNLPERAFDQETGSHDLRISESGLVGKRFMNEIRFRFGNDDTRKVPLTNTPTIIVLDSFSAGSAGKAGRTDTTIWYFVDNLLFGIGKHAMKIGGNIEVERIRNRSESNINGTYLFTSLENYVNRKPATLRIDPNITNGSLSSKRFSLYFQDDIALFNSLRLSAGMRYEIQSGLRDANNFSPRFGLSWSPSKTGKIAFRFGSGMYYRWIEASELEFVAEHDELNPGEIIVRNPEYPVTAGQINGTTSSTSYWKLDPNLANPYTIHLSVGFDGRLNSQFSFRANYTFQRGVHQLRSRNLNAPRLGDNTTGDRRNIYNVESSAISNLSKLETGFDYSPNRRISLGLDYKISKLISDSEGIYFQPMDNYDLSLDRGASNSDQRHRIYLNLSWNIKKGLRFSTNYLLGSPLPFSHTTGFDNNRDTVFNDRPIGVKRNSLRGAWKNLGNMSFSYAFSFGKANLKDSNKNIIITTTSSETQTGFDGVESGKRFLVKFYVTINNVFNHTNYDAYSGVETSPFFMKPISASRPRELLMGMKFAF